MDEIKVGNRVFNSFTEIIRVMEEEQTTFFVDPTTKQKADLSVIWIKLGGSILKQRVAVPDNLNRYGQEEIWRDDKGNILYRYVQGSRTAYDKWASMMDRPDIPYTDSWSYFFYIHPIESRPEPYDEKQILKKEQIQHGMTVRIITARPNPYEPYEYRIGTSAFLREGEWCCYASRISDDRPEVFYLADYGIVPYAGGAWSSEKRYLVEVKRS